MDYEDHFKRCPFYADFKKREKENGAPLPANKSTCSWCDREEQRRKAEAKKLTVKQSSGIAELNKFF